MIALGGMVGWSIPLAKQLCNLSLKREREKKGPLLTQQKNYLYRAHLIIARTKFEGLDYVSHVAMVCSIIDMFSRLA